MRDVSKVMGLSEDVTGALAAQVWGWSEEGVAERHAAELGLNLEDHRLRLTLDLAREPIGFPRQLGTHPGGFVLTRDRPARGIEEPECPTPELERVLGKTLSNEGDFEVDRTADSITGIICRGLAVGRATKPPQPAAETLSRLERVAGRLDRLLQDRDRHSG